MSTKTIMVSGASGFLGKELIRQLLDSSDYNIIALTSKPEYLFNLFGKPSRLTTLNINTWTSELGNSDGIDFLVNCAFPRTSEPKELAKGLDFTERLIKDAIYFNISAIINISSQSVYSQKDKSLPDETATVAPESLYGMAKYASEKIVTVLCEGSDSKINYSNIRLASLAGVEFDVRMTNKFVKCALKGEKIIIDGRGQKVSYLEVRDAASALIAMINKDSSLWNTVYNLGNHHYCSVLEIAQSVNEIAKKYSVPSAEIELNEGQSSFNNLLNSELFYKDFEWEPHYDIPLMIDDLFKYYKKMT